MPQAKQGVGSAVNDVSRELGSALGIAILGSLFSTGYATPSTPAPPPFLPRLHDTATTPAQGTTWGSLTIQIGGMQLRNAAATARAALVAEAAKRLNVKPEQLTIADGIIRAGGKKVTYGELIGGKAFALKLDHAKPATPKDPKTHKLIGKPVPRVDIPGKVTGQFTYMQDFRVPGMLHGRVVRPPAFGAKLESVDEGSIKGVAGVLKIVRDGDFVGVVAQSEWGAIKAARESQVHLVQGGNPA